MFSFFVKLGDLQIPVPQREREISKESQLGDFGGLVFGIIRLLTGIIQVWYYLLVRAKFFLESRVGILTPINTQCVCHVILH